MIDFETDFDYEIINTTEVVKPHEPDNSWTIIVEDDNNCKYEDGYFKPCEIQAMDCESCEYR